MHLNRARPLRLLRSHWPSCRAEGKPGHERPHVLAHLAERHGLDRLVEADISAVDQDFEHLAPPQRHLEAAGGVALDQAAHQHHARDGARDAGLGHSVPLTRQNSRTRSGTLSRAAMVEASSIGRC
jgi:hypothetical protein